MGFFSYLLGFTSEAPSIFPHDERDERAWTPSSGARDYWGSHSGPSLSGQYVSEDNSIGVSCVFLSVLIYAGLLGTNPIRFYRSLPGEDGEKPIFNHPLLSLLSTDGRPNPWQTGAQYRMMHVAHQTLWGLHVSRIKWTFDGMELWPIDPEHVVEVDQMEDGKRRFHISEPGRNQEILTQDEVFALDGFGTHKLIPESLLRRSREAVGVWLAQQEYRATYFSRGAQGTIIMEHPSEMGDEALKRFKKQVQARMGGSKNAHNLVVTEEGIKARELGHTARNAQLVEAWDAQAIEISRFTGVPAYILGASVAPPYASREPAMREFGDLQLKPRRRLIEAAYKKDLIVEKDVVCEIDLSDLFRGDALQVAQENAIYIMNSVKAPDEVRKELGMNPIGTPEMSIPSRSANQGIDRGGDPRQPREKNPGDRETGSHSPMTEALIPILPYAPVSGADNPPPEVEAHIIRALRNVRESSARQLLKRETENVRRKSDKFSSSSDQESWHRWLADFYRVHAERIAESLAIDIATARRYTDEHREQVISEGIGVCDRWESDELGVKEMVRLGSEAISL